MITIVVPVYNVALYLGTCVQSIVNQKYTNWECVLVDDGSTDGSGDICDEWARKDERLRVIHQENRGVSRARNCGIGEARGEYIVFVDSDDTIGTEHLQRLVNAPKADVVVSGVRQEGMDGQVADFKPCGDKTIELSEGFIEDFVDLNAKFLFYGPVSKLYRTAAIKENGILFPVDCSFGEDLQFNLAYLEQVKTITQVDDVSYFYRRGDNTLSTRRRQNQFYQDYEQWQQLRAFYVGRRLWVRASKELLYKRLWGIVYDGIFSTPTPNKEVLAIPEIAELKEYQHVFVCARWIKWCILHRIAFVFR